MTPLCELAKKYGTDKYPWYTPFYDLILEDIRFTTRSVLEIGIGTPKSMEHVPGYRPGASLRMWQDYFPCAKIYGIDIHSLCGDARIETRYCDQSDAKQLLVIGNEWGPFDLIVDDGSHDPIDQFQSCVTLFPYLRPGGVYIIEDVNEPFALPFTSQYVECRVKDHPYVGRCIVVQK